MGHPADAFSRRRESYRYMTVSERIETQSFAYDAQFPPDIAAGLPLTVACRHAHRGPVKRALRTCKRAFVPRKR
jgi:hypothetical protein